MVGQIQRVRHVRTRDDPAVVQQGRGFQRVRRPLGKEGNALKAIRTLRLDAADVTVHGRPALPHVVEHGQAPEQQGQAEQPRREVRRGLEHVAGRRLIQHGGEGVPLADQMARHKVEQGAAAREHHRRFRKQARRLEEDVARPGVHDPGKRPAPEGDRRSIAPTAMMTFLARRSRTSSPREARMRSCSKNQTVVSGRYSAPERRKRRTSSVPSR